jgi:hypothetical protein
MRNSKLSLAMLLASASIAASATQQLVAPISLRRAFKPERITYRSRSKRYPQMVTSSDAEIAEWNRNVNTRQVRRQAA